MPLSKKIQEIVDRNSHIREKVLGSISDLNEAQLNYKSEGSKWSICDIVHHLALTDEANAKLMSNLLKRARAESLPPDPSPESSEIHSADEVFARIAEPRFQAPDRLAPQSHLPVEESLARLNASRVRTLEAVEELASYDLSRLTFPHPFAGDLNAYQWMLMGGGHEYRHGEQIKRMKALPDFPK
jgi:DinB family protein